MGCGGSKVDDLPLVTLCRERKDFLKAAAEQRYALAAYHMLYFKSLKEVGEALSRFVDEELVIGTFADHDSPVLTLPTEGKKKKTSNNNNNGSSSSTSLSSSHIQLSPHHHHHSPRDEHEHENDHLHFADSEDSSGSSISSDHLDHTHTSNTPPPEREPRPEVYEGGGFGYSTPSYRDASGGFSYNQEETRGGFGYNPPPPYQETGYGGFGYNPPPPYQETGYGGFGYNRPPPYQENGYGGFGYNPPPSYQEAGYSPPRTNYYSSFMKKSSTAIPTVVYEDTSQRTAQWNDPSYSNYPQMGGYSGVPTTSGSPSDRYYDPYDNRPQAPVDRSPPPPPPPPPPPEVSAWGFFDPFQYMEDGYSAYYSGGRYGVGSITSSPDSVEVRQREGIPDLEDDTEQEPSNEVHKEKPREKVDVRQDSRDGTSRNVVSPNKEKMKTVEENEIRSSSNESIGSVTTEEDENVVKKNVTFEPDGQTAHDGGSSKSSSLITLSPQGTRDIQEVVKEIKDEFEIASDYGKEVALMLEVGKLPYYSKSTSLKVIFTRIHNLVAAPTLPSSQPSSRLPPHATSSVKKMAKLAYADFGDFQMKSGNLSSTLERLYAWERKLYKEVKDEERLRVIYEKKCKRLKDLDARGADADKIEATNTAKQKLHTKIDVSIRTVDAIARKIHKLREEELQPQITELVNGLIRMWKSMLKSHQKQFQAIKESKNRKLMANIDSRTGSSLKATVELELELRNWSIHFSNWIKTQKAYVESLNQWLMRCLLQEPEVTPDGIVPFSPSRVGAPPIFVICNDWYHAMERLSEAVVEDKMHAFALSLHQLWERQDEEQRQRLNAEYLVKDFEKRLKTLRKEQVKTKKDRDVSSDKSAISVPSESGISPLDDLKVDLDSMRKRLEEEKAKHKATIKQVHEAASSSLQGGLLPIFEALENFTSDTIREYEHVRVQTTEVV